MSAEPSLFRAIPAAREQEIPWLPVGRFPTRVERVGGLVDPSVELWVKREDDCGDLFGGNKVRKLEFQLGEARARGCRRVVTFGTYGSHHAAATSLYARRLGFEVELVLFPQPVDDHVRELLLLDQAAGARVIAARTFLGVPPVFLRASLRRDEAWLAGGGSSATGTLGWVSGGFELLEQVARGECPRPDVVYAALGSSGTVAGLNWSLWADRPIELVAVKVVDTRVFGERSVRALCRRVDALLSPLIGRRRGAPPSLRVESRYAGRFGLPTPLSLAAVRTAADAGLTLDSIYTGKVMAALLEDAREGRLRGKRVLFLHSFSTVDVTPILARAHGPESLPRQLRYAVAQ